MALALYRKYRPTTFAELIGQEHVTEPLIQALRSGRLHHAYLFSGPRGCGKTSSARILARSLNCEQGPTPDPCGECESCRALRNDGPGSIDVIEIDAASHGGVDDARELREQAFFTPVQSRYKIYVIDEAHMVSSAGFNALLKLVEEPPEYVKFVFATTEPEKVLGTIKSRTHHYPFRLIPPGVLRPYLEQLCATEGVAVEPAVFPLVVRAGGGSVRDTLSVLDQLIAGAGPEGVTYARAVSLLGVTDAALLDEMCEALAAGDGAAAYATVDRVAEAGHDPRRFAADLLERFRDLIILKEVPDAVEKGLIDAPGDQLERMSAQASRLGPATLSRCADIVHDGLVEMRGTTSPRLLLELICARMLLPAADDSQGGLLQRLEWMERRLSSAAAAPPPSGPASGSPSAAEAPPAPPAAPPAGPPAAPPPGSNGTGQTPGRLSAASPATPASAPKAPTRTPEAGRSSPAAPAAAAGGPAPASGPAGAGGGLDAGAIRARWDEIVGVTGQRSKRAAAVAREATVRAVEGDTIVLHFQHAVHATMLESQPAPVLEAVHQLLGGQWRLRCETADRPAAAGPARPAAPRTGQAAPGAAAPAGSPAAKPAGEDWPEPARPGGVAASAPSPGAAAGPATGPAGTPAPTGASAPVTAAGPANGSSPGNGGRGSRPAAPEPEPDWPDESYDDLDSEAGTPVRQSSEEQALRLLQQTFGAEKIGEVAP